MEILGIFGDFIGVLSDIANGGIDLLVNSLELESLSSGSSESLSSGSSFGSSNEAEVPVEPETT